MAGLKKQLKRNWSPNLLNEGHSMMGVKIFMTIDVWKEVLPAGLGSMGKKNHHVVDECFNTLRSVAAWVCGQLQNEESLILFREIA